MEYENNIKVIPINGNSSIILALISVVLTDKNLHFTDIYRLTENRKKKKILFLENKVQKSGYSGRFYGNSVQKQSTFRRFN